MPNSMSCLRALSISDRLVLANIPKRYFTPDRERLLRAVPVIYDTYVKFVDEWLLYGSKLVAIRGAAKAGKTSVATGIMIEIITRHYDANERETNPFLYVNAPSAFAEIARTRFVEPNLNSRMAEAGLLIIDNIHMLDVRDVAKLCVLVMQRCDEQKSTIVTMTPTFDTNDVSFQQNVLEGRIVIL